MLNFDSPIPIVFYIFCTQMIYIMIQKKIKDQLDLSKYPPNHYLYDTSRKDIPGFFKDETKSIPICQFCGLRAKCYSIITDNDKQKLATAGIKACIHKKLTHDKFLEVIHKNNSFNITQTTINSSKHTLYTIKKTRTGLSAFDVKRYILDDGISTLPFGHFRVKS